MIFILVIDTIAAQIAILLFPYSVDSNSIVYIASMDWKAEKFS